MRAYLINDGNPPIDLAARPAAGIPTTRSCRRPLPINPPGYCTSEQMDVFRQIIAEERRWASRSAAIDSNPTIN